MGIYFLLFLAGDLFCSLIFDLLFSVVELPGSAWYSLFRMAGCLILTFFLFRLYTVRGLHRRLEEFRISFRLNIWSVAAAVLLPTFVLCIYIPMGRITVNRFSPGETLLLLAASALTALKAGILEEMLFRGFIMRLLEDRWNRAAAILLPSFLFSLLHIPSMERITVSDVVLLVVSGTLVGILFSLAACTGNSISGSALIHTLWNFLLVTSVFHITTVQEAYGTPLLSVILPTDNILLTGGGFGVEASVVSAAGYLLACGLIVLTGRLERKGSSPAEGDRSSGKDRI